MNDLVKINKMLVNLKGFIAFEFDDKLRCIWCYLPNAPINHELEYVSFTIDDLDKYKEVKDYIEGYILNDYPEGVQENSALETPKPNMTLPPKPPISHPPLSAIKKASIPTTPFKGLKS